VTVRYEVALTEAGRRSAATIVLMTGRRLPSGAAILERDGPADPSGQPSSVAAWRLADDPWLPGLAAALDPAGAAALARAVGLTAEPDRPRLRAYRPGRRAVVELRVGRARLFVKVVRPAAIERLQALHRALTDDLPIPRSQGWSPELGLVVLQALPGTSLREALRTGGAVPSPIEHLRLLGRIRATPDIAAIGGPAGSPIEHLPSHVGLLSALLPEAEAELAAVGAAIGPEEDAPSSVVHGDYYEGQLLTTGGRLTGLLDIDTAGLGRAADDEATLLGHLAVLADGHPRARRAIVSHAEAALRLFEQRSDPVDLRRRAAAVILGLATGPFRVQSAAWPTETRRRIALAGRWLESADRVAHATRSPDPDETALIPGPSASHLAARP
jgi:hypothetical protein